MNFHKNQKSVHYNLVVKYLYLTGVFLSRKEKAVSLFNKLHKIAIGYKDILDVNNMDERFIYVVISMNKHIVKNQLETGQEKRVQATLSKIRKLSNFVKDYPYNPVEGLHVIVLSVLPEFEESYDKFCEGKFSEMFTVKQIHSMSGIPDDLKKKPSVKVLKKNLKKMFDVSDGYINVENLINDKEQDLPPYLVEVLNSLPKTVNYGE